MKMRNDGLKLERHHIANDVKPIESYTYKDIKIGIGDSGFDHIVVPLNEFQTGMMRDFPDGFYETVYTIFLGEKPLMEQPMWFDKNHDMDKGLTERGRELARLAATRAMAETMVDAFINNGVFQEHVL